MEKLAYYNEFDPQAAAWLRVLIAKGHIAPGVVDERSIEDVRPSDLRGFKQCHFFAGIGVWSYALRRAGWRDDRPIWTGSCPCQPFSAAGKGAGFDDERHLWPAFQWLIQECKPECVVGEQVASAAVDDWIDLVHADLEALGYAFGSVPFPSAGVGAPHIRDRNYWVAYTNGQQRSSRQRTIGTVDATRGWQQGAAAIAGLCDAGGMAYANGERFGAPRSGSAEHQDTEQCCGIGGLGNSDSERIRTPGFGEIAETPRGMQSEDGERKRIRVDEWASGSSLSDAKPATGPTNGYWADADWLHCRDGKFRPVEPGTFPLVAGAAARVVRLRGYGNAVNAEQARAWIETVMECLL